MGHWKQADPEVPGAFNRGTVEFRVEMALSRLFYRFIEEAEGCRVSLSFRVTNTKDAPSCSSEVSLERKCLVSAGPRPGTRRLVLQGFGPGYLPREARWGKWVREHEPWQEELCGGTTKLLTSEFLPAFFFESERPDVLVEPLDDERVYRETEAQLPEPGE